MYDADNTSNAIPMKDLFNMMAGTSTGSILASGLSYPKFPPSQDPSSKGQPKFYAKDIIEIYEEFGKEIFTRNEIPLIINFICSLVIVLIFLLLGFLSGQYCFDNKKKNQYFEDRIDILSRHRSTVKNHKIEAKNNLNK